MQICKSSIRLIGFLSLIISVCRAYIWVKSSISSLGFPMFQREMVPKIRLGMSRQHAHYVGHASGWPLRATAGVYAFSDHGGQDNNPTTPKCEVFSVPVGYVLHGTCSAYSSRLIYFWTARISPFTQTLSLFFFSHQIWAVQKYNRWLGYTERVPSNIHPALKTTSKMHTQM